MGVGFCNNKQIGRVFYEVDIVYHFTLSQCLQLGLMKEVRKHDFVCVLLVSVLLDNTRLVMSCVFRHSVN